MEQMLEIPEAVRLTTGFLRDRVGMTEQAIATLIGIDDAAGPRPPEKDIHADAQAWRNTRGLLAIQSLLLSAYTPAAAAAWMRQPSARLEGRSPREILSTGTEDAVSRVLAATAARIAA